MLSRSEWVSFSKNYHTPSVNSSPLCPLPICCKTGVLDIWKLTNTSLWVGRIEQECWEQAWGQEVSALTWIWRLWFLEQLTCPAGFLDPPYRYSCALCWQSNTCKLTTLTHFKLSKCVFRGRFSSQERYYAGARWWSWIQRVRLLSIISSLTWENKQELILMFHPGQLHTHLIPLFALEDFWCIWTSSYL